MKINTVFLKRFIICISLGILFGIICVKLASQSNPGIWDTPLLWVILFNRFLIGFVVSLVGIYTVHPILGFKIPSFLRGGVMGLIVSIQLGLGIFIMPDMDISLAWNGFWWTLIAGIVYGSIIDMVATRFAGEGKILLNIK